MPFGAPRMPQVPTATGAYDIIIVANGAHAAKVLKIPFAHSNAACSRGLFRRFLIAFKGPRNPEGASGPKASEKLYGYG